MLTVKFMSIIGPFKTLREESFSTSAEALAAVTAHATAGGFTNVKCIEDADSWRYTARSPGGRGGRNVAFMDLDYDPDAEL